MARGLEIKGIHFSYGKRKILEDAGFAVDPGELCVLLGANGAGKSTLLKCINGLLTPARGNVVWNGRETDRLSVKEKAKIYGYVPQETGVRGGLTVMETILSGRLPYMGLAARRQDVEKAEKILIRLGMEHLAFCRMDTLSGGERQRALIGRAMAQEPEVLLLDEPTSSLDLRFQYEVMGLLKELGTEQSLAVVAVVHDLNLALDFADQAVLLSGGRVLAEGRPEAVLTPERIQASYGIPAEIGRFGDRRVVLPRMCR